MKKFLILRMLSLKVKACVLTQRTFGPQNWHTVLISELQRCLTSQFCSLRNETGHLEMRSSKYLETRKTLNPLTPKSD